LLQIAVYEKSIKEALLPTNKEWEPIFVIAIIGKKTSMGLWKEGSGTLHVARPRRFKVNLEKKFGLPFGTKEKGRVGESESSYYGT